MQVIRGISQLNKALKNVVVAIGNFDGVHQGHQTILKTALEKARAIQGTAVAYTFRPHPQVALRPATELQLLTTYDEKLELIAAQGIQYLIEEPFSREFSSVAPHDFFNNVLMRKLSAQTVVVGYDFAFGKERAGNLDALGEFCKSAGVELIVVKAQRKDHEVVSSSRIRQHLRGGEIEAASQLLGREFFYRGIVIKGEGRGRQLGFPTANLKIENKLTLPYGVYATWAMVDGHIYPSVTNIGVRPTFQGDGPELPALVEVHLLDQTLDLYGKTLEVRFASRIRAERKFAGPNAIAELKTQIGLDASKARELLAAPAKK